MHHVTKNNAMPPSIEPDWYTQVCPASLINTGNVTDHCFFCSPRVAGWPTCRCTSADATTAKCETVATSGLWNKLRKSRPFCGLWRVVTSLYHTLTSLCFFSLWSVHQRKRLVPIATVVDNCSEFNLTNARRPSIHSSFRRTLIEMLHVRPCIIVASVWPTCGALNLWWGISDMPQWSIWANLFTSDILGWRFPGNHEKNWMWKDLSWFQLLKYKGWIVMLSNLLIKLDRMIHSRWDLIVVILARYQFGQFDQFAASSSIILLPW